MSEGRDYIVSALEKQWKEPIKSDCTECEKSFEECLKCPNYKEAQNNE